MINIAICDNEKEEIDFLSQFIDVFLLESSIEYNLFKYLSGEELLDSKENLQIIFLDIIMNKKSGIEAGAELKKRNFNTIIIYTTNMEEYMARAFNQVHAFAYLLKPVSEEALCKQLKDAIHEINGRISNLPKVSFTLKNKGLFEIATEEICYFEYCNRKIKLVTQKGEEIYIKEKIYELSKRMEEYGFAMPHQSYVVNLLYVKDIIGNNIHLKNGSNIPLAQKRAADFRKQLMNKSKNHIKLRKEMQ